MNRRIRRHTFELPKRNIAIGIGIVLLVLYFVAFGGARIFYQSYELPSSVSFAGQDVPLDDPKTYERIDTAFQILVHDQRGQIQIWLKRLKKYQDYIQAILKEEGVHEDFMYLAIKESSLLPCPLSSANARGMWQFIPATGERFGLKTDFVIDERCNIEKSTRAAAAYLKHLMGDEYFKGDVFLAMAGYNAGEKAISDMVAVQANQSKNLGYFSSFTNKETGSYVPGIIALKVILSDPVSYGFDDSGSYAKYDVEKYSVYIQKDIKIRDLAFYLEMDFLDFKNYNPHFRITYTEDNFIPKDQLFDFYLPVDKIDKLKSYLAL